MQLFPTHSYLWWPSGDKTTTLLSNFKIRCSLLLMCFFYTSKFFGKLIFMLQNEQNKPILNEGQRRFIFMVSISLLSSPVVSETCVFCSWFIFHLPGETVKWRLWIQTSLTATASQPVASTAKRATWWTTATAAWCTCQVGSSAVQKLVRS